MQKNEFDKLKIPDVVLINSFCLTDERGSLVKEYSREILVANRIAFNVCETLFLSSYQGVLRGLHFQRMKPQAKIIYCLEGSVWAVVVDVRCDSASFGKWVSVDLSSNTRQVLFVPAGCALGTLALKDSLLSCHCGENFFPEYAAGIRWDDRNLGIDWPIQELGFRPIISIKDQCLPSLQQVLDGD